MPITSPYSLALDRTKDAKDAVAGTTTAAVSNSLKIYIGANWSPSWRQTIVGELHRCFRYLQAEHLRGFSGVAPFSVYTAGGMNIGLDKAGVSNISANHVAIVGGAGISQGGAEETFKQLINRFLELSASN